MIGLRTIERRIDGEIMGTDVLIRIASRNASKQAMEMALDESFRSMREFADRFSRFRTDNELWRFNESEGGKVSIELFDLLSRAVSHFRTSSGRIDPSVLPALEREGYHGAYVGTVPKEKIDFTMLAIDPATRSVRKPRELKLDFGGFGKGYIVDRIADKLAGRYPHVLVDAGGDIAVRGSDVGRGETGWIIDVENPATRESSGILLRLSDGAVATSGKNRRTWKAGGSTKHHLIDPATGAPSESDLLSATVLAPDCETADTLAKQLFLLGKTEALETAERDQIPLIVFNESGTATINRFAESYVIAQ